MTDNEPHASGTAQRFAFDAVRDTLGSSTGVDSCVTLAARINALMDQAFDYFQSEGAGIACRAGCSFCCHLRVMVFPHEAIALFRFLGSRMPKEQAEEVRQRVIDNAALIAKESSRDAQAVPRVACAFLVNGRCSAHEVRPAACSGYHSLNKERCEEDFRTGAGSPEGIPVLKAFRYVAAAMDDGMDQALGAAGLSGDRIELHTAVAALIRQPSLIERWRSGREWSKDAAAVRP